MAKKSRARDTRHDLNKRVRELRCLYDIANITGNPDMSLREKFTSIAGILPQAFQYHGNTFSRITVKGEGFINGEYRADCRWMSADIFMRGVKVGAIEIGFNALDDKCGKDAPSHPDRLLLNAVAERLGSIAEHRETEERIREEKLRAQHYLDIAGAMLVALDATGTVTMVNRKGCEILECAEKDIIGKDWFETFLPERMQDAIKTVFRGLMEGNLGNFRYADGHAIRTWGGREKVIRWHNSIIKDEAGNITGTLSSGEDVTERLQAEKALRESEEKFSKAFRASPSMLSITTLEDGTIIDVNDSFTHNTGYSRGELISRTTRDGRGWINQAERAEMRERLEERGSVRDLEVTSVTKSGELRHGQLSADIITIGGRQYIISLINDITEQRQNQKLLHTIYESSPLGIYINQDEILQYTNPQFQRMTGFTEEELRETRLLDLVMPEDTDVFRASTETSLQQDNAFPCEFRLRGKTGAVKWVLQSVSPIFHRGKKAILGSLMDISERKFLERKVTEYQELSKMKGDLLSMVSHELRTPLTTIKGYSTMILDYYSRLETREMKDCLESIDNATDRLTRLVDNLLDTSRMEAGLLKLEKAPANITLLIEGSAAEARLRSQHHRITVTADSPLSRISIDQKRIRQVLDNLLDNAIKYTPQGKKIVIATEQMGSKIRVSVTDQGPGIPAEELKKVFRRMYRIERRPTPGADGMGLGLYISRMLVEAHGGIIWAESPEEGSGSIVAFTLPAVNHPRRSRKSVTNPAGTLRRNAKPGTRPRERSEHRVRK